MASSFARVADAAGLGEGAVLAGDGADGVGEAVGLGEVEADGGGVGVEVGAIDAAGMADGDGTAGELNGAAVPTAGLDVAGVALPQPLSVAMASSPMAGSRGSRARFIGWSSPRPVVGCQLTAARSGSSGGELRRRSIGPQMLGRDRGSSIRLLSITLTRSDEAIEP